MLERRQVDTCMVYYLQAFNNKLMRLNPTLPIDGIEMTVSSIV